MRLLLLLKKDLSWNGRKRRIPMLVAQLLLPLIIASFISFLMHGNFTTFHEEEGIVSHESSSGSLLPKSYRPPFKIKVFYPKWENASEFRALKDFCEDMCAGYMIEWYSGPEDLQNTAGYTAFLIIETWKVDKPALKYRFIDFQWKLQKILTPLWGLWSLDQKAHLSREGELYCAWTQRLLDAHFYRRRECRKNPKYCQKKKTSGRRRTGLNELVIRHAAMPFFNPQTASVLTIFGQLSTFLALFGIWQVVEQMAEERKTNSMMFLESLQIHNYQYLLSFWLVAYVKFLLQQLLLWIPPTILLKGSINFHIVYPGILIYSAVLAAFAILMGTVFHRPFAAKFGTAAILLILNLGILAQEDRNGMNISSWMEAFLFPNAYYFYLRAAATRQAVGFLPEGGLTSMMFAPFLLLSTFWMWLFAFYFHVVYPGDGRQPVNWNYLYYIMKDWKRIGKSLYEEESFMKEAVLFDELILTPSKGPSNQMQSFGRSDDLKKSSSSRVQICAVQLEGVCKSLNNMWIVNRVTMKILYGEVTVIYGPRGAGGKEILELISTRILPDFGELRWEYLNDQKRKMIVIHGEPCFLPQFTVRKLIDWTAKMRGGGTTASRINEMIDELALKDIERKRVEQLNLVQKQLLALLLAFVGDPNVILLDEPTKNCSLSVKNAMHAFILRHRQGKAIVISTYDPMEAETCCSTTGQVAFLSRGHLVSLGSVASICKKYNQSLELLVWTSGSFSKQQRLLIESTLNRHISKKSAYVTWEQMPNESIRFLFPNSKEYPLQKVIKELEKRKVELGIKYFEVHKQNIQDAYYNCLRKHELDEEVYQKVMLLEHYYKEPKKKSCWPELGCIFRMNLSFLKAHWVYHLCSLLIPLFLLLILYRSVIMLTEVSSKVQIGMPMLKMIDGSSASIVAGDMKLRIGGYSLEVEKIDSRMAKELFDGRLLYHEPPILAGLTNFSGLFHIYHMKMLRFGDLLIQNLFINSVLDAPVGTNEQLVHMTLESQEAVQWSKVMAMREPKDAWLPGLGQKQLASILIRQWTGIMIIGGLLTILLARASMFIGQLATDNCVNMYYLMGARKAAFWTALFFVDLAIFLIGLVIGLALLLLLGFNGFSLGLTAILSFLAFVSILPCIYMIALGCRNTFSTYAIVSLCIGVIALLPACLPGTILHYGSELEEWSQLSIPLAFLCPPLAAALGAGIFNDLIQVEAKSPNDALKIILPLVIASFLHIWLWLLLAAVESRKIRSKLTKLRFWWEEKTMSKKKTHQIDAPNGLEVARNSGTGSQLTTINTTGTSTASIVGRTSTMKDETIFEDTSRRSKAGQETTQTAIIPECLTQNFAQKLQAIGLSDARLTASKYFATPETSTITAGQPGAMPAANTSTTTKSVKSGKEAVEADDKTSDTTLGLWEQRDANGSATPIIVYDTVSVDHYSNRRQTVSFNVFDLQSVNLFGDRPEIRSYLLDIAAGRFYPLKGFVTINGKPASTTSKIGYVPFDDRLCTFLTGRESLELAARLKKYHNIKAIANFILQITELDHIADRYVLDWGVSDRRMLQFALAVVDHPTALLLDELDASLGPIRMKIVWAIVCLLREVFNVPVLFSSSRTWECETISSHTVMIYQGAISLADTSVEIKKRFSSLAVLTISLIKGMDRESVASVICSQLKCEQLPLPDNQKLAFLLNFDKYVEMVCRVQGLMSTIGINSNSYELKLPGLDTIYHAHFTA